MSNILDEHLGYIADPIRLDLFRTAIAQAVQPGNRVADVGCGSAILGLLCLQAGAGHIDAIDSTGAIEIARQWWRDDGSKHCKNLFFRNHKGDRHYLVCFDSERSLAIRDLEARLRQGKLTFASPERMERWLGLRPGSVSPFGLINDPENHVHLFLDVNLRDCPAYSFHPNDNRATVVIPQEEFLKYLAAVGNSYEFIELY